MNYKSLVDELFKIRDEKYAIFSKSLSNSDYVSIGVKTPFLKDIIKRYKNDTDLKLEDFVLGEYLEVDYLYFCLSLSRLKTVDDQFDFIINNIKKAKSWCITDSLSCFLKKHLCFFLYIAVNIFIMLYHFLPEFISLRKTYT